MSDNDERKAGDLMYDINYDLAHGIHTMGPCSGGCGRGARGSKLCSICSREELGGIVQPELAQKYYAAVCDMNVLHDRILRTARERTG